MVIGGGCAQLRRMTDPSAFRFAVRYPLLMLKDLPVNLGSPKDVVSKMPQIKEALAEARPELDDLKEYVELLTRLVGEGPPASAPTAASKRRSTKGRAATAPTKQGRTRKAAPAQEQAVQALRRAGRSMGPADLFRFMEAEGLETPVSVGRLNAILWAAAKAGRVVKQPDSTYALHPSTQLPGPPLNGSSTATQVSPQTQYAPGSVGT
jgi:hypothetical protein